MTVILLNPGGQSPALVLEAQQHGYRVVLPIQEPCWSWGSWDTHFLAPLPHHQQLLGCLTVALAGLPISMAPVLVSYCCCNQ